MYIIRSTFVNVCKYTHKLVTKNAEFSSQLIWIVLDVVLAILWRQEFCELIRGCLRTPPM